MEQISDHLSFMADEKRNEFIVEVEQDLTIKADYDRILQVLINVTKNSIQFTENGRIWLRGRNGFKETILEIEDTGIG
ncbi:sensor histidine kinase, partial [Planococcus sp. SIMBA_143]